MPDAPALLALTAALTIVPAALGAVPSCARVLTHAEVQALAPNAEAVDPVTQGPGHSECSWIVGQDGGAVMFTVWEKAAMDDFPVPTESPARFFEMMVKSSEDARGAKREALPKVGARAAMLRDGGQRLIFVQSRSGVVAQLVLEALNEQQVTAAIQAIADL